MDPNLDPLNFQEKQHVYEQPKAAPLNSDEHFKEPVLDEKGQQKFGPTGFPLWKVEIECSMPTCDSVKVMEVERSDVKEDPTKWYINELRAKGRCHCCLDSTLATMIDDPEDDELHYKEWEGYEGNKYNKCCCADCKKQFPGRRFISGDERTLTKLWKAKGYSDEEIAKRIAARVDQSVNVFGNTWEPDPNKTVAENLEVWNSRQEEALDQMRLDRVETQQELDKNPNVKKGSFEKHKPKDGK